MGKILKEVKELAHTRVSNTLNDFLLHISLLCFIDLQRKGFPWLSKILKRRRKSEYSNKDEDNSQNTLNDRHSQEHYNYFLLILLILVKFIWLSSLYIHLSHIYIYIYIYIYIIYIYICIQQRERQICFILQKTKRGKKLR